MDAYSLRILGWEMWISLDVLTDLIMFSEHKMREKKKKKISVVAVEKKNFSILMETCRLQCLKC